MGDLALVLVIVLIVVLIWRGPKTLPLLGRAFGQGVKEARKELDEMKGSDRTDPPATPPAPPTPPTATPPAANPPA